MEEPGGLLLPLLALAGCAEHPVPHEAVITIPEARVMQSVPVFGGTLESVPAVRALVSADPEGNMLRLVLDGAVAELDLGDNARPFRIHVEDTTAWVTLRGTGELAEVDLGTMSVTWRTPVCGEVRGVTRAQLGHLVVACAEGTIVEVDDEGEIVRSVYVATDLRDILSIEGRVWVSRFRRAEVLLLEPQRYEIIDRYGSGGKVAWRMRVDPLQGHGVALLHQLTSNIPLVLSDPPPGTGPDDPPITYYPNPNDPSGTLPYCGRLHESVVTRVPEVTGAGMENVRLATDFAVAPDGTLAFANTGVEDEGPAAIVYDDGIATFYGIDNCVAGEGAFANLAGRPSAVAFDADGVLYIQAAGPFGLVRADDGTTVSTDRQDATTAAHTLFHQAAPTSGVACASCHPEGLEDGFAWTFRLPNGATFQRRTMALAGSIRSREPYHWDGNLDDPDALMADTYAIRMGGLPIDAHAPEALFDWLDDLRPVRGIPLISESGVELGREVFLRAGCAECHSGPAFTNNQVEVVRKGVEAVKTPTLLGVGTRLPLLHDGCAATIEERFQSPCDDGKDSHGTVSNLFPGEIVALSAYLRTL